MLRLKRLGIIVLGTATLWHFFYIALFMGTILWTLTGHHDLLKHPEFFPVLMVLHMFTMALALALLPVYVLLVLSLPAQHASERTPWMVAIVFLNFLGMAAFFYKHLWPTLQDGGRWPADNDGQALRSSVGTP